MCYLVGDHGLVNIEALSLGIVPPYTQSGVYSRK